MIQDWHGGKRPKRPATGAPPGAPSAVIPDTAQRRSGIHLAVAPWEYRQGPWRGCMDPCLRRDDGGANATECLLATARQHPEVLRVSEASKEDPAGARLRGWGRLGDPTPRPKRSPAPSSRPGGSRIRPPARGRPCRQLTGNSKILRKIPGVMAESGLIIRLGALSGPSTLKVTPIRPPLLPPPSARPMMGSLPNRLLKA